MSYVTPAACGSLANSKFYSDSNRYQKSIEKFTYPSGSYCVAIANGEHPDTH